MCRTRELLSIHRGIRALDLMHCDLLPDGNACESRATIGAHSGFDVRAILIEQISESHIPTRDTGYRISHLVTFAPHIVRARRRPPQAITQAESSRDWHYASNRNGTCRIQISAAPHGFAQPSRPLDSPRGRSACGTRTARCTSRFAM